MSDKSTDAVINYLKEYPLCQQAGYLPVPLDDIPFEILSELDLYLQHDGEFALYREKNYKLTQKDIDQLIEADVHLAYVPIEEHGQYYQIIEKGLGEIVTDPEIQQEKKAEILYSTCIALVDQLYDEPPEKAEFDRVENASRSLVEMVIQNQNSFKHLFDVSNHDFYTATHMVNVCTSLVTLGMQMNLDRETLTEIGTGALLHDIGKLFIPKEILNKEEKLTDDEYRQLQQHVTLGVDYLESKTSLSPIAMAIVKEHHERLDGSGYPHGLKGEELSIFGRMSGMIDTYEAMTSVRPYRKKSFSLSEVMKTLFKETPHKFDPGIFEHFQNMVKEQLNIERDWHAEALAEIENEPKNRYQRFTFRMPMIAQTIRHENGKFTLGSMEKIIGHNISQSGLGFLSPKPVDMGQNIYITIPELKNEQTEPLIAVVTRCKDYGNGWYAVGAKFHRKKDQDLINLIRCVTLVQDEWSAKP